MYNLSRWIKNQLWMNYKYKFYSVHIDTLKQFLQYFPMLSRLDYSKSLVNVIWFLHFIKFELHLSRIFARKFISLEWNYCWIRHEFKVGDSFLSIYMMRLEMGGRCAYNALEFYHFKTTNRTKRLWKFWKRKGTDSSLLRNRWIYPVNKDCLE